MATAIAAARQQDGGSHKEMKALHAGVMSKVSAAQEALLVYSSAYQVFCPKTKEARD